MEDLIKLELTQEEATTLSKQLEQLVVTLRNAHEQMELDQIEIDRLKAETAIVLADLGRMLGGNHVENAI